MDEKEIVESIDHSLQYSSFSAWENPANTTATTMELAIDEPEDFAE